MDCTPCRRDLNRHGVERVAEGVQVVNVSQTNEAVRLDEQRRLPRYILGTLAASPGFPMDSGTRDVCLVRIVGGRTL